MQRSDELEPDPGSDEMRFGDAGGGASPGPEASGGLSHIETGPAGARSRMVDVGGKDVTARSALARAVVAFPEGELASILAGGDAEEPGEGSPRKEGARCGILHGTTRARGTLLRWGRRTPDGYRRPAGSRVSELGTPNESVGRPSLPCL